MLSTPLVLVIIIISNSLMGICRSLSNGKRTHLHVSYLGEAGVLAPAFCLRDEWPGKYSITRGHVMTGSTCGYTPLRYDGCLKTTVIGLIGVGTSTNERSKKL